ncbi:MAG: hypothetical protein IJW83_00750 [Clostridia bacterium]|nr:hypothetical protein [Clostridia bacterium]
MKKLISLLLVVTLLIGCTALLSSCGAPKDAGAEIIVYLGDIVYDFDPSDYVVDDNEAKLLSLMYEPLFTLKENGRLQKAAAKNYRIDRKERTITVNLRETYWSDGRAVQAQDFIFAWRDLLLDPTRANPAAALLYDIENAVEIKNGTAGLYDFGAVAVDINTIEITYREGADVDQLLKNLASIYTAPVREDCYRYAPDCWSKQVDTITSNGPFMIKVSNIEETEQEDGSTVITAAKFSLTRNLGYHQHPDTVNYTKQVTPESLVTFWAGEEAVELSYSEIEGKTMFFMGDMTVDERETYKKKAEVNDLLSTYSYVFNTDNELFANEHVRRALSLALDRAAMQQAVVFGKAAEGFHPSTSGLISTEADTSAAEAELALAGTLPSKAFTLTVNNDEDSVLLANMAKAAWEELGFTVTVEALDYVESTVVLDLINADPQQIRDSLIQATVKDASYGTRTFDVIAVDWQMYSEDTFVALCEFTSDMNGCGYDFAADARRTSITGWTSAAYDQLIKDAFNTTDDKDAREALLLEAEQMLIEAAPVIPVLYNQNFAFVSKQLSGVSSDGFGFFVMTKAELKDYQKYTVAIIFPEEEEAE